MGGADPLLNEHLVVKAIVVVVPRVVRARRRVRLAGHRTSLARELNGTWLAAPGHHGPARLLATAELETLQWNITSIAVVLVSSAYIVIAAVLGQIMHALVWERPL